MKLFVLLLTLPMLLTPQQRPNFSGTWVLDAGFVTGSSRGGDASERRPTSVHTSSGAAFNCGKECEIRQKGGTLTIARAQLADFKGKDPSQVTPDVTLALDGREASVVDSFSPSRKLPATARWQGATIRIDTAMRGVVMNQTLSLEARQLVVVTSTIFNGEARATVELRYKRK